MIFGEMFYATVNTDERGNVPSATRDESVVSVPIDTLANENRLSNWIRGFPLHDP